MDWAGLAAAGGAVVGAVAAASKKEWRLQNALMAACVVAAGGFAASRWGAGHDGKRRDATPDVARAVVEDLDTDGEEDEENAAFEAAVAFAGKALGNGLDNETKLAMYSLFKQATQGPCTASRPSMLDFVASAKWSSWRNLGNMGRTEAKAQYVQLVGRLAPGWRSLGAAEAERLAAAAPKTKTQTASQGMGPSVSTMAVEAEKADADKTPAEVLMSLAGAGDTSGLLGNLRGLSAEQVCSVCGPDGETLLHMACDRGDLEMIRGLVRMGADVAARDVDGLTPLAYALMNDNEAACLLLVGELGADALAESSEGEAILELCSDAGLAERVRALALAKAA